MKLNKKGKLKVAMADVRVVMLPTDPPKYRASKEADVLEFEPDDFQGAVILTVEEAKEFKSYFDFVCNGMSISDSMWGEVHYLRNKIWGALNRSEQAEKE